MRLVIQKVSEASCKVDGNITGSIGNGFMVLVGISVSDDEQIVEKMAVKMSKLRVFVMKDFELVSLMFIGKIPKRVRNDKYCNDKFAYCLENIRFSRKDRQKK